VDRQLKGQAAIVPSGDLETAMRKALAAAAPGEWVLLSPGCASFDQFKNYEHRGQSFKAIARQLGQEAAR
jgi:UDP-N-acetylmuramoylalanine--D-glutamate ligase